MIDSVPYRTVKVLVDLPLVWIEGAVVALSGVWSEFTLVNRLEQVLIELCLRCVPPSLISHRCLDLSLS